LIVFMGGHNMHRTSWRSWLSRTLNARRPERRAGNPTGTNFRPQVEMLESRVVPALSWNTVAGMPTARSGLAAAVGADGRIYAIGGTSAAGPLATVEAYSPATNSWATAASISVPRTGLAAVEGSDGRIYVIGGMGASGLTNVVEAYNPGINAWTQVANLPTARSGLAAVTGADGRIYAIGGVGSGGSPVATVEAYTPANNTWNAVANLIMPRSGLAVVEGADSRVYAIGGTNSSGVTSAVEAYSPKRNVWSQAASLPTARTGLAGAEGSDGRIYAIGGANTGGSPLATVEAYTPSSNSWAAVANLPTARSELAAAAGTDGRIYALGGTGQSGTLMVVEALTLSGKASSSTAIISSVNPSLVGQNVTFTATVSSGSSGAGIPTGTIQFQIDGSNAGGPLMLQSGMTTATYSTSALAAGTHTVTAKYSGDSNVLTSTGTLSGGQTVSTTISSTTVVTSANPSSLGQSVTFTATVSVMPSGGGTPTGTVQFQIDGSNAGNAVAVSTSGGVTTASFSISTLAAGTHTVAATYSGDSNFPMSTGTLNGGQVVANPFVAQIYLDLLYRPVDASGAATFSNALAQGATRNQVIMAIVSSPEYRMALVTGPPPVPPPPLLPNQNFYGQLLGRVADVSGLNASVQFLNAGGTDEQLQAAIAGSAEYFAKAASAPPMPPTNEDFLNALYRDLLGRAIDPSGELAFSTFLANGGSRTQVAAAILSSDEYRTDLIQSYYQRFLNRAADPGGLKTFIGALQSGVSDEQVITAIVGSQEYLSVHQLTG
jgi:N-acetylneuraminic acid mutarotase